MNPATGRDEAVQLSYVGFSHRYPFSLDAYELGFAPGVREDYTYQREGVPNAEYPVVFLDNEFRDPDLARYLEVFDRVDPSVAVLGDAYTTGDVRRYNHVVEELAEQHPYKRFIVAAKCNSAVNRLSSSLTLGVPAGYSGETWRDVADPHRWRGNEIHVLGGNPHRQWRVIDELTQPTIDGQPPADVVGVDWNGPHLGALKGEYWTPSGWEPADHLSIRESVRRSLQEIKGFWQDRDVWPDTEPRDLYGPAVQEPDELLWMDRGGDPIPHREALEQSYVDEYQNGRVLAFQTEREKNFVEYREGLTPV